ncbi:GTP 3',8-cyclase MoaA [Desulfotalea psychrophila]|uniref:GTP 3',8-cyclase n=1 Tax=Desulfotalea psychrophila (strain LSv54 / DSM 12343) TaxID=177439 RepID=Q6AIW0_DESPS|nr:GTP 3',8-cyclase MoaA [Desulfotalea psychrophila]CAG37720.1 probable molybdenum cofactor biosynthesis protein (MoaA) [Desulfotalea psychrophila LSv54]
MNVSPGPSSPQSKLVDTHGRSITYLRLSITDRCNLRCRYCMPEEGVQFLDHSEILSYQELLRISRIFVGFGVNKIRITGGEPFVRRDCVDFMQALMEQTAHLDLRVTTNGIALSPHLGRLKEMGLGGINLSLDTLDPLRFSQITRRDGLTKVLAVFHQILSLGIPLKVNTVVMEDTSDEELRQMAALTEDNPIQLRFIELMPFSGKESGEIKKALSLEDRLVRLFPELTEISSAQIETARKFSLPGYRGNLGLIEGESRKFCAHCNKVRITSCGMLKNCLYDSGVLDLRALLRNGADDVEVAERIQQAVLGKLKDGHVTAELQDKICEDSMATIGG